MKLSDLREKIISFKNGVKNYRQLLMSSLDYMAEISSNHQEIEEQRSELVKTYAKLEIYIKTIGKNPRLHDGVWATLYSAYDNGLSADIINRVGPSIDAMLTDLDYIEGKLEDISDKEFDDIFNKKETQKRTGNEESNDKKKREDYWNLVNPFWLLFQLGRIIWKHKIVTDLRGQVPFSE